MILVFLNFPGLTSSDLFSIFLFLILWMFRKFTFTYKLMFLRIWKIFSSFLILRALLLIYFINNLIGPSAFFILKYWVYSPPCTICNLTSFSFIDGSWWKKKLLIRIDLHVNLWQSVSPLITLSQSFREGWNGEKILPPPTFPHEHKKSLTQTWWKWSSELVIFKVLNIKLRVQTKQLIVFMNPCFLRKIVICVCDRYKNFMACFSIWIKKKPISILPGQYL